jgi:hypothetical protein
MATTDEELTDQYGWEVEYLSAPTEPNDRRGTMRKCPHPAARSAQIETAGNETTPVLALYDEDDQQIALYNGLSWIAVRRMAAP